MLRQSADPDLRADLNLFFATGELHDNCLSHANSGPEDKAACTLRSPAELLGVSQYQNDGVPSNEKLGNEAVLVDRRGSFLSLASLWNLQSQSILEVT
jgi:hypothetical protein